MKEKNSGIEKVIISGPKHIEMEYFHILLREWRIYQVRIRTETIVV